MILVKYLGFFSEIVGAAEEAYEADEALVRDLIDPRVLEAARGDLVVLVNGLPGSLDTRVKSGDVVAVLPHMGGG